MSVPSSEKGKYTFLVHIPTACTCPHVHRTLPGQGGMLLCTCRYCIRNPHGFLTIHLYIVQHNPFLTKTFLLRSKHQLSNNASILAKSASITGEAGTGEAGDSTGDRDDEDDPCSASGVLTTGVTVFVSRKYIKVFYKCNKQNIIHVHVHVVPKYLQSQRDSRNCSQFYMIKPSTVLTTTFLNASDKVDSR